MIDRARPSICRINVGESRGTGTLVARDLVVTACHVVADRAATPPAPLPGTITLTFPGHTSEADVVEGGLDAQRDWAILRLRTPAPQTLEPVPLGDLRGSPAPWVSFGFPDANPEFGMAVSGSVRMHDTTLFDAPTLQLFSEEAAAGQGAPVRGLSGAPVIVGEHLVGVLRFALMKDAMTVAGTLYACPARVIQQGLPGEIPAPARVLPFARKVLRTAAAAVVALATAAGAWGGWYAFIRPTPAKVLAIQEFVNDSREVDYGVYRVLTRVSHDLLQVVLPSPSPSGEGYMLSGLVDTAGGSLVAQLVSRGRPEDLGSFPLALGPALEDSLADAVLRRMKVPADPHDLVGGDTLVHRDPVLHRTLRQGQSLMDQLQGGGESGGDPTGAARVDSATALFRQAVAHNPQSPEAWASLSMSWSTRYFWSDAAVQLRQQWADSAEQALKEALILHATIAPVVEAQGVYRYRVKRDYAGAIESFDTALSHRPGDATLSFLMGLVKRRVLAWEDAVTYLTRASDGDPTAWDKAYVAGETLLLLRRFDDARTYFDRALAAAGQAHPAQASRQVRTLLARGILDVAAGSPGSPFDDAVGQALERADTAVVVNVLVQPEYRLAGRMVAPTRLQALFPPGADPGPDPIWYHLARADVLHELGDSAGAAAEADSAMALIDDWGTSRGDSALAGFHLDRAFALALLGRKVEAVQESAGGLERLRLDLYVGSGTQARLVHPLRATEVRLLVGDTAGARSLVRDQLDRPGHFLTEAWLAAHPLFEPLRPVGAGAGSAGGNGARPQVGRR